MESYRNAYGTPEKQGKASGGDHFIVEDLFDFPNDEDDDDSYAPAADAGHSTESSSATVVESTANTSVRELGFLCGDIVSGELLEPYDELAELEWMLVEQSFSSEDLEKYQLISGMKAASATSSETGEAARPAQFRSDGPVPAKARSKRSRAAPCSWSSRLLALSPSPAITAAAAAAAAAADSSSESELFIPMAASVRKAPPPARKKDPSTGMEMAPSDGRRCLHCQTDKTPQWRTGPMGPKTLCNACGVRYKSGRLVPEYRPAASPTFVLSKHSNSHRKVLELRRQKEVIDHHHYLQQNPHHQYQHQPYMRYDAAGQPPAGDDYLIHHRTGPDFRQLI